MINEMHPGYKSSLWQVQEGSGRASQSATNDQSFSHGRSYSCSRSMSALPKLPWDSLFKILSIVGFHIDVNVMALIQILTKVVHPASWSSAGYLLTLNFVADFCTQGCSKRNGTKNLVCITALLIMNNVTPI